MAPNITFFNASTRSCVSNTHSSGSRFSFAGFYVPMTVWKMLPWSRESITVCLKRHVMCVTYFTALGCMSLSNRSETFELKPTDTESQCGRVCGQTGPCSQLTNHVLTNQRRRWEYLPADMHDGWIPQVVVQRAAVHVPLSLRCANRCATIHRCSWGS